MEKKSPRVALVTGANSGIGHAIAKTLAKNNYNVIAVDRSKDKMELLAAELKEEGIRLRPYECDLTNDSEVEELFKFIEYSDEYGRIDVCINNAGVVGSKSLLSGTTDEWRKVNDINVISLLLCSKLAVNLMLKKNIDDGHLINLGSVHLYYYVPQDLLHFYRATKFAVKALSEGIRYELVQAKSNIRVTVVSPGSTLTNILMNSGYTKGEQDVLFNTDNAIRPEDIANSVLHCLSAPPEVQVQEILVSKSGRIF